MNHNVIQPKGCPVYLSSPQAEEDLWDVKITNPAVSILGVDNLDIIDLPNFKSSEFPSIETADDYPLFAEWIKSDENALLNTSSLNGACSNVQSDDVRVPKPYDADGLGDPFETGAFSSIFARSTDDDTGNEVVFIYDRHLGFYENTVENPLPDGGGSLVIETYDTPGE